ncbi:hypothetical protein R1sor_004408 [Riccia sorocarpa]|uniref:Uncharacterized protein n=1 Tax=Riccia sorocarpa TaxID=122646 RepID=A0ABD3HJJ0_9MARC
MAAASRMIQIPRSSRLLVRESRLLGLSEKRDSRLAEVRCALDEFPFQNGPIEPAKPKFSRDPHTDLSFIPVSDPAAAPKKSQRIKIRSRRRRNRPWKKATPAQAIVGSIVGGFWAVLAHKATSFGYEHLASHPVAHDLPLGLTTSVNSMLISAVTGFGWLAVCLFGVTSLGLALLAVKLLTAPKLPPQ